LDGIHELCYPVLLLRECLSQNLRRNKKYRVCVWEIIAIFVMLKHYGVEAILIGKIIAFAIYSVSS